MMRHIVIAALAASVAIQAHATPLGDSLIAEWDLQAARDARRSELARQMDADSARVQQMLAHMGGGSHARLFSVCVDCGQESECDGGGWDSGPATRHKKHRRHARRHKAPVYESGV